MKLCVLGEPSQEPHWESCSIFFGQEVALHSWGTGNLWKMSQEKAKTWISGTPQSAVRLPTEVFFPPEPWVDGSLQEPGLSPVMAAMWGVVSTPCPGTSGTDNHIA